MDIKHTGTQWQLAYTVKLDSGLGTSGDTHTIQLPPGFTVLGGLVNVVTAFDGTTPTITVSDDSDTPVDYFAAVSLAATGDTALAAGAVGLYYPAGAVLTISGGASDDTEGEVHLILTGVRIGRVNERNG